MSDGASPVRGLLPVNILTGFLGSGKTTLLRRLLTSQAFSNCAVLINELGEIGLDHELLGLVDQETVVLSNGCICCGIRDDLAQALLRLNEQRERGVIPAFDRVVIETTGLADPVPVLNTIVSDPMLHFHFRVGTVVTTVDAVHGRRQLREHPESVKQAALADRLVITKADLASEAEVDELRAALGEINPASRIITSRNDAGENDILVEQDIGGAAGLEEIGHWFVNGLARGRRAGSQGALFTDGGKRLGPAHTSRVETLSLIIDEPLDWAAFGVWFSMLLHQHGARILRIKGILNIKGSRLPTVVHGVQHLIHPPTHLAAWPSADHRSRLVLIGDLPAADSVRQSLVLFNRL